MRRFTCRCPCRVGTVATITNAQHYANRTVDDSLGLSCSLAEYVHGDIAIAQGRCDLYEFRSGGDREGTVDQRWKVSHTSRGARRTQSTWRQSPGSLGQSFL